MDFEEPLRNNPNYKFLKKINQGAFGFVVLARRLEDQSLCAVKFMQRGAKITRQSSREFINHSRLLHPHVIQFREVFLTEKYLAIAMEYAPGGDMFQHVKRKGGLEEGEARWFFQQLIIGLDYCHKMGVVNRDIKLENTLLDGGRRALLKICDFGYSKNDKDSLPKSKVGTPGYTAPEILTNSRHYDGASADVWSAGVMLFVMLFCEYPFERPNDVKDHRRFTLVLERVMNVQYSFPEGIPVSDECKDLLSKVLVGRPSKRYTIQQIQQHPWYLKDLPKGVIQMNNECLKLKDHSSGFQTEEEIQSIVMQAIGTSHVQDDDFDDDAMNDDDYYT